MEVLNEEPQITDEKAREGLEVEDGSIRFDHVYFRYTPTGLPWNLADHDPILPSSTPAEETAKEAPIRQGLRSILPGTTKVIIAQRISSVQDADIIVVLDDGKISGVGSHTELLKTNEIYREVYESQQGGGAIDG